MVTHLFALAPAYLRNSFSGPSGSLGSRSSSQPPSPRTFPSLGPAALESPAGPPAPAPAPAPGRPGVPCPPLRGPGLGQGRGGPAPARKLESFVLAPRPARRGGGVEAGAGEASGGPGPGSGPDLGHFPTLPPGLGLRDPRGAQNWTRLARDLSASSVHSRGPGLVAHLGLLTGNNSRPSSWGRAPHFAAFSRPGSACLSVNREKEVALQGILWIQGGN